MKKNKIISILLICIVFSILISPFVLAINSCGGQISCECGDIITSDYYMQENLIDCPDKGLLIGEDGVSLNCNNKLIEGIEPTSTIGIDLGNRDGVIIRNCLIGNFQQTIQIGNAKNFRIDNVKEYSGNDPAASIRREAFESGKDMGLDLPVDDTVPLAIGTPWIIAFLLGITLVVVIKHSRERQQSTPTDLEEA